MQLTRLEVKGFKSFGDKITINFNEGVTAIVGPNGCGKSNVVDAIRWVLGEQSTKMLRSDKMENIIFNGTKKRKASNLAEVSLTFDNTKNILPTEFTTVTVTRKLYRNGDSEYRLNDVKCRLKDITDLFLDTGVGSDSYSIIELKMVDEIINNKDNSRRNLFEEASGISKYKVRKRQTLSKLKETESDLSRVDDLLFEINKNLKSLEYQAKKADRYFRIKSQYKEASIELAHYKIEQFATDLNNIQQQEKEVQNGLIHLQTQISIREAELQALKKDIIAKEKNLSVQQKTTNEHIHRIRTYESEKKIKNEQIKFLQEKEQRLKKELSDDQQQLNHVLYNLKRLNEEAVSEDEKLKQVKHTLEESKSEVEALRGQQQSTKIRLDQFKKENENKIREANRIEKDLTVLKIQKDALEQESLRNITDTTDKQEEIEHFNLAITALTQKIDSLTKSEQELVDKEEKLQADIQSRQQLVADTQSQLLTEQRQLDARQNEYNLTKSLVDNLEGFPESIRFLRKKAGWQKQYPLFSDILFCREEYRIAIENYLEPFMNHYVVDTEQDAIEAIKLLSDSSRGRASFFILDKISLCPTPLLAKDPDLIHSLDIIQIDQKYRSLCEHLLHNVYISHVDTAQHQRSIPDTSLSEIVILDPTGKYTIYPLGMSGGSLGLFEGKRIGRAKNLEKLAAEIKQLDKSIHKRQSILSDSTDQITVLKGQSVQEEINRLRLQISSSNNELISVRTKQEQYQSFIESSQNRKHDIAQKLAEIEKDLRSKLPLLESLHVEIKNNEEDLSILEDNYITISDELTDRSTIFNQHNISFHQQQNKLSGIHKDMDYRESQKESLENKIEVNRIEYEKVKSEIQHTLQFVDHNDTELIEMYNQKEQLEAGLKELEDDYYNGRATSNDLETVIASLRQNKDKSDFLMGELKDKKTALQIDLNALKERLSIEFDIDIQDLLDDDGPIELSHSQEELQVICRKLKKQLDEYGNINPMAKEAYDEINERFQFITKEKEDLLEAHKSLMATISEIDHTAQEKFMEAFIAVRENFIQVFRSLFNEEDTCDLILSDPERPLESDIEIMARPKGKKPLSINQLSGGEKTLTATALLFSLYLLKPAPFCIFDEVDAPLDDTNIDKFNNIIREFSNQSQFIIVSHNKRTIASTDIIYGVTMIEPGVSKVVAVDLRDVA